MAEWAGHRYPIRGCIGCASDAMAHTDYVDAIFKKWQVRLKESPRRARSFLKDLFYWARFSHSAERILANFLLEIKEHGIGRDYLITKDTLNRAGYDKKFLKYFAGYSAHRSDKHAWRFSLAQIISGLSTADTIECSHCGNRWCEFHERTFLMKHRKCAANCTEECRKHMSLCYDCSTKAVNCKPCQDVLDAVASMDKKTVKKEFPHLPSPKIALKEDSVSKSFWQETIPERASREADSIWRSVSGKQKKKDKKRAKSEKKRSKKKKRSDKTDHRERSHSFSGDDKGIEALLVEDYLGDFYVQIDDPDEPSTEISSHGFYDTEEVDEEDDPFADWDYYDIPLKNSQEKINEAPLIEVVVHSC